MGRDGCGGGTVVGIDDQRTHDLGGQQRSHWTETLAANEDMYGLEPSEAAVHTRDAVVAAGGRRLLELGAGQGRDTFWFAAAGLEVDALDFAPSGVEAIRARAEASGMSALVRARQHDVRDRLPFDDDTFDACYSHMLFCMALSTSELEALAAEVRRVVRPGGIVVYTVRHTGDAHYGTGVDHGDGMFEQGGYVVHFFDRALVDRLAAGFDLVGTEPFEEGALPRRLWRIVMRVPSFETSAP